MAYRFTEAAFPFTTAASVAVDAASVRTAVGLASANLDTQLTALSGYVDCLPTTLDGSTFTSLPAVALTAAYDPAKTAAQASTALSNLTWTDAKAAFINAAIDSRQATVANLANAVTMAAQFATMVVLDGAVYDFTAAALAAAPTGGSAPTVEQIRTEIDSNSTKLAAISAYVDCLPATLDGSTFTAIPAGSLTASERNSIADAVLSRNMSNVEATAGEHTLCTIVLATLESSVLGTTWTVKRTDGSTTHATKTVTTDASADPITGVS